MQSCEDDQLPVDSCISSHLCILEFILAGAYGTTLGRQHAAWGSVFL